MVDSLYFRYIIHYMEIIQRASHVLNEAEASLRRLIVQAAEAGDYRSAEALARCASRLAELPSDIGSVAAGTKPPGATFPSAEAAQAGGVARASSAKPAAKRRSYPIFARSGTSLVKIGWSKSSKSEYHHKSPLAAALGLAAALARHAKNGAVVPTEKVLPLRLDDGSDVPDYQAYVSLAWFRQIGAVKQNGRQGYTVKRPSDLQGAIQAAWNELAEVKAV